MKNHYTGRNLEESPQFLCLPSGTTTTWWIPSTTTAPSYEKSTTSLGWSNLLFKWPPSWAFIILSKWRKWGAKRRTDIFGKLFAWSTDDLCPNPLSKRDNVTNRDSLERHVQLRQVDLRGLGGKWSIKPCYLCQLEMHRPLPERDCSASKSRRACFAEVAPQCAPVATQFSSRSSNWVGRLVPRDFFFGSCIYTASVRFYLDWMLNREWLRKAEGDYEGAKDFELLLVQLLVSYIRTCNSGPLKCEWEQRAGLRARRVWFLFSSNLPDSHKKIPKMPLWRMFFPQ